MTFEPAEEVELEMSKLAGKSYLEVTFSWQNSYGEVPDADKVLTVLQGFPAENMDQAAAQDYIDSINRVSEAAKDAVRQKFAQLD